ARRCSGASRNGRNSVDVGSSRSKRRTPMRRRVDSTNGRESNCERSIARGFPNPQTGCNYSATRNWHVDARPPASRSGPTRERDHRAARGQRGELPAVDRVADRGGANRRAERHVPEILPCIRVERDEVALTIAREHETARGREHAGPRARVLAKIPSDRAAL